MKTIAAGLVALFVAALAASAQDIHLPKLDLQKLCKQNNTAVSAVFSNVTKDYISVCVEDEQNARAEIVKEWASFPALAKSRCIQPREFFPGYTEWLTCLQMTRDALKLREDSGTAGVYSSGASRQCPTIRVTREGQLRWVDAC